MPIVTLEGRLREVCRIRLGVKVPSQKEQGKTYPKALHTFRITSPTKVIVEQAAELWGGDPVEWRDEALPAPQWQVTTEAAALPCLIPPAVNTFSQWYEMWSAAGCQRRCNGRSNVITDGPCECPEDPDVRNELAKQGKACKPTTRLSVMLPQLHEFGVARLESHGWYAAVELAGAQALYHAATAGGQWMPAELRIEKRTLRRPGEPTKNFIVPALAIRTSLGETLEALGLVTAEGLPGPRPAIAGGTAGELGPGEAARATPPDPDDDEIIDVDPVEDEPDPAALADVVPEERDQWDALALTRAHEAGLDAEETLELVKLVSKGRTPHFDQFTELEWLVYWQVVERLRTDELGMLLEAIPGEDRTRWRFCDNRQRPVRLTWDDQATITVELTTSDQYRTPADWKETVKGSGITMPGLLRQARAIAESLGKEPPADVAGILDPDVASRLAQWVAAEKQARQKQQPVAS